MSEKHYRAFQEAEKRWAALSLDSYVYEAWDYFRPGLAGIGWYMVEVEDDDITRVCAMYGDSLEYHEYDLFDTIDQRFKLIDSLMTERGVARITLIFDSLYGYPKSINVEAVDGYEGLDAAYEGRNLRPNR